ncbi:MAG: hypothetical protein H7Y37_05150 [Anaerolineae bacterium]|nr:hypothetical protein [Gloeobacterales cyanobacterium ES-bin-313]
MSEHRLDRITIERPRRGGHGKPKRLRRLAQDNTRFVEPLDGADLGDLETYELDVLDNLPRQISGRKEAQHAGNHKYLTDNLKPLERYLHKQVGRPWDKVYSELCKRLDRSTVSGMHVFSHIHQFVKGFIEPGKDNYYYDQIIFEQIGKRMVPHLSGGGWQSKRPLYNALFIHPSTGMLTLAKPKVAVKPLIEQVVLNGCDYRKIDGNWFDVCFQKLPAVSVDGSKVRVFDVLAGRQMTIAEAHNLYGKRVYAESKRQCNKYEIRAILKALAV